MKLIVGLGNPGSQYRRSRHNLGFEVVNLLEQQWAINVNRQKFQGRFGSGMVGGQQVALLKPETFMNRSGGSVIEAVTFYKLTLNDIIVVLDDMDLELGQLRLRQTGSAGGHNGLKDIIVRLGDDDFARLRIGIGTASENAAVNHVLGSFRSEEAPVVEAACRRAVEAVECWARQGIDKAMNRYNRNREFRIQNSEFRREEKKKTED
jgi:peptidyl-tRNA hydrolase, PTH1 family